MSDLDVALVAEPEVLAALSDEWWSLWENCPAATPFSSPAWLLAWWRVFQPTRPVAIVVRRAGRLAALGGFWREDGALGRRLLPLGIGISDYLDILASPDVPGAAEAVGRAALALPGWDVWSVEDALPEASVVTAAGPVGHDERLVACPVLGLPAELPGRKRRKLAMARHRLARRPGRLRTWEPDEAGAFLGELVRLHGLRWRDQGETGVLDDPRVPAFHAVALPELARRGLAVMLTVEVDGEAAGAFYGLRDRSRTLAYIGGFDPAFAFESPGTILIGHAIEEAERHGSREFHFLRGREPYKYEWGAIDRMTRAFQVPRG